MSEFEGFGGIIGKASDLVTDDYVPIPPPVKATVVQVATIEELQQPSPKPFEGRADPDYPDLDSLEPLYIPKFLLRRYGIERWERSPFLALWRKEAGRAREPFRQDLKPERKRK